jgi:hypothetical protein
MAGAGTMTAQGGTGGAQGGGSDAATGGGGAPSQGGNAVSGAGASASGSSGSGGSLGAVSGAGGTDAAGASGLAGAGGETDCEPHQGGDIQAWLHQDITNEKDNGIHPAFLLTRTGLSVPLNQLAIRYYFSAEGAGDWILTCLWVTKAGDSGSGYCDEGVTLKVVTLDPPRQQTDQYLEVSFAGVSNATLSDGFPIEARTMFWRDGRPMLNLANDYSFVANLEPVRNEGTRAYKQTSRVTVYRNGALVWGEEPCP